MVEGSRFQQPLSCSCKALQGMPGELQNSVCVCPYALAYFPKRLYLHVSVRTSSCVWLACGFFQGLKHTNRNMMPGIVQLCFSKWWPDEF